MNEILNVFLSDQIFFVVTRVGSIVISVFYFLYTLVLATRIRTLDKILTTKFAPTIKALLLFQVFLSLVLVFLALFLI